MYSVKHCCIVLWFFAEYVREVELQKKASEEEKLAQESFDAGDFEAKGIVEILEKLNKSDQLAYYYSGGLQLVKQIMKDSKLGIAMCCAHTHTHTHTP